MKLVLFPVSWYQVLVRCLGTQRSCEENGSCETLCNGHLLVFYILGISCSECPEARICFSAGLCAVGEQQLEVSVITAEFICTGAHATLLATDQMLLM